MSGLSFVLILLAATAGLRFVSEKLDIPHTALLVFGGLLLAAVPDLPRATLDPDVVFLVFVPPPLYSAALTTSWRDFRLSGTSKMNGITSTALSRVVADLLTSAGRGPNEAEARWSGCGTTRTPGVLDPQYASRKECFHETTHRLYVCVA